MRLVQPVIRLGSGSRAVWCDVQKVAFIEDRYGRLTLKYPRDEERFGPKKKVE